MSIIRNRPNSALRLRQFFGLEPGSLPDSRRLRTRSEKLYRRGSDRVRITRHAVARPRRAGMAGVNGKEAGRPVLGRAGAGPSP